MCPSEFSCHFYRVSPTVASPHEYATFPVSIMEAAREEFLIFEDGPQCSVVARVSLDVLATVGICEF